MKTTAPILPGKIIGVLGSGQLGRMLAIEARKMGYRVHTYSPESDTPTGQVADREWVGAYEDLEAVRDFARSVDVVTFEFENVPAETAAACAQFAPVRPAGSVLHTTQNRLREKTFLRKQGLPTAAFRAVSNCAELEEALGEIGYPAILKTAGFGYDGKGQTTIHSPADVTEIQGEYILESFVDFEREVSVVAARGRDGAFAAWPVIENAHRNHILDVSVCPADVPQKVARRAEEIARTILEALEVVGVLCVEFFLTGSGELLVNELAPRPHNSGHLTFGASLTSQFEQQLRAVCGLPLGATTMLRPAAMANLLGDCWAGGEPDWAAALSVPNMKLHLYGKAEAKPGRKLGHLTALGDSGGEARERVVRARELLNRNMKT
jgi:5-(carboxyamino)imidazole ribonucleotide synthase